MPGTFARREPRLRERMEDQDADPAKLARTYAQLRSINAMFSGWSRLYRRYLRPRLDAGRTATLLDVGFGGGDLPLALARWARRDGLRLRVTAIDPDERAVAYARAMPAAAGVQFARAGTGDLVATGARFDFVISNHLLHHLRPGDLASLLEDARRLAGRLVLFNDIERSPVALVAFGLLTWPFFRRSYTVHDGLVSIRRSYRAAELRSRVAGGWEVRRMFPYRLLLMRRAAGDDAVEGP